MAKRFSGIHVPLVTPFTDGKIDWPALEHLVAVFAESPFVAGIVPNGSTGECSALATEEQEELIAFVVSKVRRRKLVTAGTGTNNLEKTLHLTKHAEKVGADAVLVVPPYYVRPNQEGIERYFLALAKGTRIDIVLYNIPVRTACNIEVDTVSRLAERGRFVGIKECSTERQLLDVCHRFYGSGFTVLSGDDAQFSHCVASGGDGAVLASGMIHPEGFFRLFEAASKADRDEAVTWDRKLLPLVAALFAESNPIVVKYAMALRYGTPSELRLPLVAPKEASRKRIEELFDLLKIPREPPRR